MKLLHSYVPEITFLKDKHQTPSRAFFEDCAVLDAANGYCVLASRGKELTVGSSFLKLCGIPTDELDFLERALVKHSRALIHGTNGPILIFAELLLYTDALIAILPQTKVSTLLRALMLIGRDTTVAISPAALAARTTAEADDLEACEHAAELFFYMDRILTPSAELGVWTRSLLIANFAGCRLDRVSLPTKAPTLSAANEARLQLFLLCCFLTLRHTSGSKFAIGNTPARPDGHYRYLTGTLHCTEGDTAALQTPDGSMFPFLSLPAFNSFSARVTNGKIVLAAQMPQASKTPSMLHSAQTALWHLCLELFDAE